MRPCRLALVALASAFASALPRTDALAAAPPQILPADEQAYLDGLYLHLHRHPELSLKEQQTAAYLMAQLDAIGLSYQYPMGAHNIAGLLDNGDGPVVLLRTDMDALPVSEATGKPYASEVPGVLHACGHDLHMTVWLGVLRNLAKGRDDWQGKVLFVAESAEEIGRGSRAMLDAGLFERFPKPDFALAYHDDPQLPPGTIGITPGWAMANVDMLSIRVRGRGGHGAQPQKTIDPVVLASKIVLNLQTIVSREVAPTDPTVITVGSIHGGTAGNIIPDEVELQLTVRSFGDEQRQFLLDAIRRTCAGTAMASGVPEGLLPEVKVRDMFTPALYNDPALAARIRGLLVERIGADHVVDTERQTIGEDFSRYGRAFDPPVPSCMLRLGAAPPARAGTVLPGLHSALFAPDYERAIPVGVTTMSGLIRALTTQNKTVMKGPSSAR
jgi:hippurate hydrolase